MQNESSLIIYQKYLDLIYYTNDIVKKYPKHERFALVQETKSVLYEGVRYLVYAQNETDKIIRLNELKKLNATLSILKLHIRLANKYTYISLKNYESWSNKITDVCNLLGAWIKSCAKK